MKTWITQKALRRSHRGLYARANNTPRTQTMTQAEKVLRHLKTVGKITPMDAIREYGCLRLGARICDLRRAGYPIRSRIVTGENRFGEPTHYAEYSLEADDGD